MKSLSASLNEIQGWIQGRVANLDRLGDNASRIRVTRPAPLGVAREDQIAFFMSKEYQRELLTSRAGIIVTGEPFIQPMQAAGLPLWGKSAVIACADPYLAMAIVSEKFGDSLSTIAHVSPSTEKSVHPSAVVHPTVEVGAGVRIGAHVVVEEGAQIGAGSVIYPGCYIGPSARIGEGCVLFPNVTLYEWVEMGKRVRIHAGTRIGVDGFGYAPEQSAGKLVNHRKVYHFGRVVIGDDVEIGANCTVDRGTLGETVIGPKVKLDDQVHVAHNCTLAEGAIMCGGSKIAGSSSIGAYTYIAGMVGIANKVHIGADVVVGACSLVSKDVPDGKRMVGNPMREHAEHFRVHAALNRMVSSKGRKKSSAKSEVNES